MPTKGRKAKFKGKETKWEGKRRRRTDRRLAHGKFPLAEPLTIAPAAERKAALAKGELLFYDGKTPVPVDLLFLKRGNLSLQGVYKTSDGKYITLRHGRSALEQIILVELKKTPAGWLELMGKGHAAAEPDLGHMNLNPAVRGEGLGLKASSKAERYVRARKGGKHRFKVLTRFGKLFLKLGYRVVEQKGVLLTVEKSGRPEPRDDLTKYHRIEAIDPKTGKARIFTFPIKRN